MKMRTNLFDPTKSIILFAAIIMGFILSFNGWEQVFAKADKYPLDQSLFLILAQSVCFAFLGFSIWYVNLFFKIRSWQWKLIVSVAVLIAFCIINNLWVGPYVHPLNDIIKNYEKSERHFYDSEKIWVAKSVIVFLVCYMSSWLLMLTKHKMEAEHNYENLEKQALQSKIDALNNQINPHFFFNSLNSLYSLVFNDEKAKSLEYINNMSAAFRYIMQSEQKRLVPLREEIGFLDTYLFMLKVKYDKKLQVDRSFLEKYYDFLLPVLSLLPLIENVTKHNEISNRYPMQVEIFVDENLNLVFSNKKRERLDVSSVGVGLDNLNKRVSLIIGKEIVVEDEVARFTVKVPLTPKE